MHRRLLVGRNTYPLRRVYKIARAMEEASKNSKSLVCPESPGINVVSPDHLSSVEGLVIQENDCTVSAHSIYD